MKNIFVKPPSDQTKIWNEILETKTYLRVEGMSEDVSQFLGVHLRFASLGSVQHRRFDSSRQRPPEKFGREFHCPEQERQQ
jgi:hypothetical protein